MKRFTFVAGAMLALLFAATVLAEPAAEAPKKKEDQKKEAKQPSGFGGWNTLAREAKLTEEQQAKLKEIVASAKKQMDEWKAAKAEQLKAAEAALAAARESKDEAKIKEANAQRKALLAEGEKFKAEERKAVMELLTPEQVLAWDAYNMCNGVLNRLSKAKLTDEQKAKVRALCDEAIKHVAKADAKEQNKVKKQQAELVEKQARAEILTDEQRADLAAPKEAVKEKQPAAEKPGE